MFNSTIIKLHFPQKKVAAGSTVPSRGFQGARGGVGVMDRCVGGSGGGFPRCPPGAPMMSQPARPPKKSPAWLLRVGDR